jgi:hypothetical protein
MAKRDQRHELSDLEKVFRAKELRDQGQAFEDEVFKGQYPRIYYYLNEIHVGDKVTEPGHVKLSNDGGDVLLSLVLPGGGAGCDVMARTVQEAFLALEEKLARGPEAFRFWKGRKAILRPNGKQGEKE